MEFGGLEEQARVASGSWPQVGVVLGKAARTNCGWERVLSIVEPWVSGWIWIGQEGWGGGGQGVQLATGVVLRPRETRSMLGPAQQLGWPWVSGAVPVQSRGARETMHLAEMGEGVWVREIPVIRWAFAHRLLVHGPLK
jgi:hypothetical protein